MKLNKFIAILTIITYIGLVVILAANYKLFAEDGFWKMMLFFATNAIIIVSVF